MLSTKESARQSSVPVVRAWEDRSLSTPSGLGIVLSYDSLESESIVGTCEGSLLESSTPTVAGHLASHKKDCDGTETEPEIDAAGVELGPHLGKSKHSAARSLFRALDCRRSTVDLFDDSSSDVVKVQPLQPQRDTEKFPVTSPIQGSENLVPSSVPTTRKTVRLTDTYDHADGYTSTREIIRSRTRSNQATRRANVNGQSGGKCVSRVRSLDCMRNATAFENDLDVIQTRTIASAHPELSLRVETTRTVFVEERWRSGLQSMVYGEARERSSVTGRVEVC